MSKKSDPKNQFKTSLSVPEDAKSPTNNYCQTAYINYGWQCPVCMSVWSPTTVGCFKCNGQQVTALPFPPAYPAITWQGDCMPFLTKDGEVSMDSSKKDKR